MAGKKKTMKSAKKTTKQSATKIAKSSATTKPAKRAAATATSSLSSDLAAIRRRRFSV